MDAVYRKAEGYTPLWQSATSERILRGRSARVLMVAAVVAVTLVLGIHYDLLHTKVQPHAPEHALPDVQDTEFDWYALEPKRTIVWTPCYTDQKCARLLLPLDYDTPEGPTTAIALRMIPATDKANYRGTIFLNPGGPGGSGTNMMERAGKLISRVVGPSFDLLGFDPRGTGMSTPLMRCFDSDAERDIWMLQEGHQLLNASDSSVGLFRARAQAIAQRCEQRLGGEWGIARFVSTANVVRDMLEMSQMLGQEKLQYWGFSYGSVLGQYFAAMYPDKIKRLIIDGVYDAHNYRAALWNSNMVDIESGVQAFFTLCHRAGPEKCALYDTTPAKIRDRVFRVFDAVEKNPVPVALGAQAAVVTRKALLKQFFESTYKPLTMFRPVVDTIHAIETSNMTALTALAPQVVPVPECKCSTDPDPRGHADTEATWAIACGDGDEHPWDLEVYKEYYKGLERQSHLMAPMWGIYWLQCAEWTIRPKWRWTGPLEARNTSHPVLVVSTTHDPVTPFLDAQKVVKRYGGAGLLTQDSYGHCSLSSPSVCTAKYVRQYFVDGTLPEEGVVCEPDELPLVGKDGLRVENAEDAELLGTLKELMEAMPVYRGGL